MKSKYLKLILCLILAIFPIMIFASGSGTNEALQFLKGDGAIEQWFLNAFAKMEPKIDAQASKAASLGKAIGGIGALMYMGYLGWQMQEGSRPWEVTPLIRPVIIGFILMNWVPFTQMIKVPFEQLASPSVSMFNDLEKKTNDLRVKRYELQRKIVDKAITIEAEQAVDDEKANKKEEDGIFDKISNTMSEHWRQLEISIKKIRLQTNMWLQNMIGELIEAIALTILRVAVYGIFAIQKLWSFILIVLGPIAVGMALIPGFEGSLQNWIAKFININLYTFVAFTSMSIGNILIASGYEMEISRYEHLLKGSEQEIKDNVVFFVAGMGSINIIIMSVVGYLVTAVMVLMTPTIADSIVAAGGAGIASKMKQSTGTAGSVASKGTGMAMKGAKAVATKGTSLAKDGAKIIGRGMGKIAENQHSKVNKNFLNKM